MSEVKHTPTPWMIKPEETGRDYIRIRGTSLGDRYKIANIICPSYPGMHECEIEETRANAAFIVRACNAHDDLVAALQNALAQCLAWQGEPNEFSCEAHKIIVQEARQALSKAKGA